MKLQKQVAYKYKGKTHYKYVIVVPQHIVVEICWTAGQELSMAVDGSRLVFEGTKRLK